jgi:hypothetical protein
MAQGEKNPQKPIYTAQQKIKYKQNNKTQEKKNSKKKIQQRKYKKKPNNSGNGSHDV